MKQSSYIPCNKRFAKLLGLNAAILFEKLLNTYGFFECREFSLSQHKISDDTALSKFQVAESTKILIDNGILTVTKKGIPCRNWYSINLEKVLEILENSKPSNKER